MTISAATKEYIDMKLSRHCVDMVEDLGMARNRILNLGESQQDNDAVRFHFVLKMNISGDVMKVVGCRVTCPWVGKSD